MRTAREIKQFHIKLGSVASDGFAHFARTTNDDLTRFAETTGDELTRIAETTSNDSSNFEEVTNESLINAGKAPIVCLPFDAFPDPSVEDLKDPTIILEISGEEDGLAWEDDDYLVVECEGTMSTNLVIRADFFCGENEEARMKIRQKMIPGYPVKCCFELKYLDSSKKFPPMLKGHLKGATFGRPTKLSDVRRVELAILGGREFSKIHIEKVYLTKTLPDLTIKGKPIVDEFGQYTVEFPGETHSEAELSSFLKKEYEWSLSHQAYPTKDFDEFGGYCGLTFEAKGRFYRHFDGKNWWLVDPLGHGFFSMGVCYGHRTGIYGIVDSMEELFTTIPGKDDPLYGSCWTTAANIPEFVKRNGRKAAEEKQFFNFARANMMRVFGEDWFSHWVSINVARMKQWGFNTISVCVNDYEDERTKEFLKAAKMPYCVTLKDFPKTETCLFRDFPDVFSEEYDTLCKEFSNQVSCYADDPYFIGYFVTNEPEWMFEKSVNVAEMTLASETWTDSKKALLAVLEEHPETTMEELRGILIQKYLSVPETYLQTAAPNALNLGFRYSSVTENDFAGEDALDVFSFNCYKRDPREVFSLAEESLPLPYLIGEYHIGAYENGLLSGALINTETQAERGRALTKYMRAALESPKCVGCHYFEWNDQPLLGRFDGENQQIGFIDVCNRPYQDCVDIVAAQNRRTYEIRSNG